MVKRPTHNRFIEGSIPSAPTTILNNMKLNKECPFLEYDSIYLNFHKGMRRWQVCLVSKTKRRTILYSKYLMSVKMKRVLSRDEEVDHIDNDKENDDIENLEIVSRPENKKKYDSSRSRMLVNLKCPACGKTFSKERRQTHLVKGGNPTNCSKACGIMSMRINRIMRS